MIRSCRIRRTERSSALGVVIGLALFLPAAAQSQERSAGAILRRFEKCIRYHEEDEFVST